MTEPPNTSTRQSPRRQATCSRRGGGGVPGAVAPLGNVEPVTNRHVGLCVSSRSIVNASDDRRRTGPMVARPPNRSSFPSSRTIMLWPSRLGGFHAALISRHVLWQTGGDTFANMPTAGSDVSSRGIAPMSSTHVSFRRLPSMPHPPNTTRLRPCMAHDACQLRRGGAMSPVSTRIHRPWRRRVCAAR